MRSQIQGFWGSIWIWIQTNEIWIRIQEIRGGFRLIAVQKQIQGAWIRILRSWIYTSLLPTWQIAWTVYICNGRLIATAQPAGILERALIIPNTSQCFPKVPTADGFYRLLDIWLSATLIEDSLLSIRLFEFWKSDQQLWSYSRLKISTWPKSSSLECMDFSFSVN